MLKLGFIGAGNMASAIISGAVGAKLLRENEIGIFDRNASKVDAYKNKGFCGFDSIEALVADCNAVVLSVKPQNFTDVLPLVKTAYSSDKLIISIAAGITADFIKKGIADDCKVVLAMPNTPLLLGVGATALSRVAPTTDADFSFAKSIFESAGVAVEISADKMNEIIPANGSSPAFFYKFAKVIAESVARTGIDEATAIKLVAQTMLGSAKMMIESGKTPTELIDMVCSPGGATIAGLNAFEHNGFSNAVNKGCEACVARAYELQAESRPVAAQASANAHVEPAKPLIKADDNRPQSDRPWFEESTFYQIYPLGFCGAPEENDGNLQNRIAKVKSWIPHMLDTGVDAVCFNPVFDSDKHGYDTRDLGKIDVRLGTNADFADVCNALHEKGIRVILDGVFNHVGRGFWAFKDVQQHRENSQYKDWFCINFGGNSHFNDGFWYEGWEGHFELVKLNLHNRQVRDHIFENIAHWIDEFGIDGLRLDVAYMLNEDFLRELRRFVKGKRSDFFLMGETIHGDYNRIVNDDMLDSCTNYECYKGLYSSFNDKNMFEIAHSLNRQFGAEQWTLYKGKHLFNFIDNHDVSRIGSLLKDPDHLMPLYGLMFGMPGIPCVYYGSEWGAKGEKNKHSDAVLRACFDAPIETALTSRIADYSYIRSHNLPLCHGTYRQIYLTNKQLVFEREYQGKRVLVAINCDSSVHETGTLPTSGKMFDLSINQYVDFGGRLKLAPNSANFFRCD